MTLTTEDDTRIFSCDSCECRVTIDDSIPTPPDALKGWQERPDRLTGDSYHYCSECLRNGRLL